MLTNFSCCQSLALGMTTSLVLQGNEVMDRSATLFKFCSSYGSDVYMLWFPSPNFKRTVLTPTNDQVVL